MESNKKVIRILVGVLVVLLIGGGIYLSQANQPQGWIGKALTGIGVKTPSFVLTTSVSPENAGMIVGGFGNYKKGDLVSLNAVPVSGYKFDFWSGDISGTSNPVSFAINSDKTVVANFAQENTFSLSTNVNIEGAGTINASPAEASYAPGSSVQLTAVPNNGYIFIGWGGGVVGSTNPVSVTMDSRKEVTANFYRVYTIISTINPEGSGTVSPKEGTFPPGTVVTFEATPASGYKFSGWGGDASGSSNKISVTAEADKTIIANFISK